MSSGVQSAAVIVTIFCLSACGKPATENPENVADAGAAAEMTTDNTSVPAALPRTASAAGARVFFITPADGATVQNPIPVEFGIEGMGVVKAGDDQPDSGHHHLLIDTGLPDMGLPIPADERHVHFGDGSTNTEITLEPGQHTLRLLLGDHLHIPHDPPLLSNPITITVE